MATISSFLVSALVFHLTFYHCAHGFVVKTRKPGLPVRNVITWAEKEKDSQANPNPITKASWYATEAFGKVFGSSEKSKTLSLENPPASLEETLERLQVDNKREYFLSGEVDKMIYDEDCTFSDPFVAFQGRDRFVENLANLGSFITEYSARPLAYNVQGEVVETKFMVKLKLNLPWQPVLAWPWGVTCKIDPATHLIVLHEESWDIEPWEGVKQIFRKATTTVN